MITVVVLLSSVVAGAALSFDDKLEDPELKEGADQEGDLNPWSDDSLFAPRNSVAGAEDVQYRVLFVIESDDDVSEDSEELGSIGVVVDTADDMFTGVGEADFEKIEVNGTELDVDPEDIEWGSDSGGSELNVDLDGVDYDPSSGDEFVLVFGGVDNPTSPGEYEVDVKLNGDDGRDGELEIVDNTDALLARRISTTP